MPEIAVADLKTAEDFRRHAKALRDRRKRWNAQRPVVVAAEVAPINGWEMGGYKNQWGLHRSSAELIFQASRVVAATASDVKLRPSIKQIQQECALGYDIDVDGMTSQRRESMVVQVRQVAMLLSKILRGDSLPEIGRRFGGRDHTTVLHACRKLAWLQKKLQAALSRSDPVARWVTMCVELYPPEMGYEARRRLNAAQNAEAVND